jgi:hypothetical protein
VKLLDSMNEVLRRYAMLLMFANAVGSFGVVAVALIATIAVLHELRKSHIVEVVSPVAVVPDHKNRTPWRVQVTNSTLDVNVDDWSAGKIAVDAKVVNRVDVDVLTVQDVVDVTSSRPLEVVGDDLDPLPVRIVRP